jgi:hypothetical protein
MDPMTPLDALFAAGHAPLDTPEETPIWPDVSRIVAEYGAESPMGICLGQMGDGLHESEALDGQILAGLVAP